MGVIWNKIWHDLWQDKWRTLQVVLIVGVGAFAIGMIISARNLMAAGMAEVWTRSSPMMIGLWVDPPVDDDMIIVLKDIQGVENVEGLLSATIEWRLDPDQQWQSGVIAARADYEDQIYATVDIMSGVWPEGDYAAIGQGVEQTFGIHEGGSVMIRSGDRTHVVQITGTLYNNNVQPPGFGGPAQFYVTRDQFEYMIGRRDFDSIMAAAPEYDEEKVKRIATDMQTQLEKAGVDSGGNTPPEGARYADPHKHFFQDTLDAIFLVMGFMGGLALILGLFLVYNTINAIVSQQIAQIGIMKAVGASTGDILLIYLLNVLMYGIMALLIAVPLGAVGGWALNNALLASFSTPPGAFAFSPLAVVAQVVISLLAPLIASLIPIFTGARITVRAAISSYGLSARASLLDRLLAQIERIPRKLALTISNTFRHRGRVILTQITLVLSGLIFMMVMAVNDSTTYTFTDVLFSILNFNVTLQFEDAERIEQVEELTLTHPEVQAVEMWALDGAKIRPADEPESDDDPSALLFGVPLPTQLYGPQMRAGRWLQPEDAYAVVLNEELAEDVAVGLGDWITLDHGVKGESRWQVVGLLFDPILTTAMYAPRAPALREMHSVHKARSIWIQTRRDDPDGEATIAKDLRQFYEDHQLEMSPTSVFGTQGDTATGIADNILGQFAVIIMLLLVMACLIGIVGSIALSGVLSLNVMERRREIGVMRAIGASSGAILGIFIGEGLILGWLSWLIALPLSVPAGRLMNQALGDALQIGLVYNYTPRGAMYWMVIVTLLSVFASYFPARGATRVSVRESLAYQ